MDPKKTIILSTSHILPVKIGGRFYPTTDHYVLSSLLKNITHQDILLSHSPNKVQDVFNYYDQEQFIKVIYEACNKFNEKKCRSIQHKGKKTIGSMTRELLKSHGDFFYKTNTGPFPTFIGVDDMENLLHGYNIVGHSLLRMKHIVEKLPDLSGPMEYIFWKSHPEAHNIPKLINPRVHKTLRLAPPLPLRKQQSYERQEYDPDDPPLVFHHLHDNNDEEVEDFFVDNDEVVVAEDEQGGYAMTLHDEDYEDQDGGDAGTGSEEKGYNPEYVPTYDNKRVRWVPTNMNSRLDDLRGIGAQADFLYSTDAPLTDPFSIPNNIYSRTNPFEVFKIYKAAEHLIGYMKSGMDIKAFINKPVDAILWECKISPELFTTGVITPKQRQMIFVEYWNKFMTKTIPYYAFIEKEILYPLNLAGFIRKEYVVDLNDNIGARIKDILFSSFIYQVIERSYPHVDPNLKNIIISREMKTFDANEFETITAKLYHLFFQGSFRLDEEGTRRIMMHESFRLSLEEINHAIQFVPCKIINQPTLDIQATILDPMTKVSIKIDDNVFHDLYQYIYYKLFIFYGDCTHEQAYQYLFHNGEMMDGKDAKLQNVLGKLIDTKKKTFVEEFYRAKYHQYPQVREVILYAKATKETIHNEHEPTMSLWNKTATDTKDLELMKWVVTAIPSGEEHMERSIYLYAFLRDLIRSLALMKSMIGKRLYKKSLDVFFQCFYPQLKTIQRGVKTPKQAIPNPLVSYFKHINLIQEKDIENIWYHVQPLVYIFQQKGFSPSKWHAEAKKSMDRVDKEQYISALANTINCLYPDQEVSNDQFYLIIQILSGKDEIPMWPDPSFEMMNEITTDEIKRDWLPKDISKRLPKTKKTSKILVENVRYNLIHPSFARYQTDLQKALKRSTPSDPTISRASYALVALQKETFNPRRILFFT